MTKEEMLAAIRRHDYLVANMPPETAMLGRVEFGDPVNKTGGRVVDREELAPQVRARIMALVVDELKRQAEEAAEVLRRAGVQVN